MTMATRQSASGIRFNDCVFSEPVTFANWTPPGCGGLFAVLMFDPSWAPRPLRAIYFSEFGNNTSARQVFQDCSRVLYSVREKHLFISALPMPFTTTAQRRALLDELITGYHPAYQNHTSAAASDLAHKVNELEKRHQEQNAQVMLLAAGINRFFEPQIPAPPRRRIGFNPLPEPGSQ